MASKPNTRQYTDAEVTELDVEQMQLLTEILLNEFIEYVAAHHDKPTLADFKKEAAEFAHVFAVKGAIMEKSGADGVLALEDYNGNIQETINNVLTELQNNGISVADVYSNFEEYSRATTRYAKYLSVIISLEWRCKHDVQAMRDIALDDLDLIEHVLAGIEKFPGLDPCGLTLQLFKKAVLDPTILG